MPKIREIKPQKRHRERWTLTFDNGGEATIEAEIAVRERLTREVDISDSRLEKLLNEDEQLRAYRQALRWLARRRHTRREMERRLLAKGFSEMAAQAAGERLEQRDKVDPQAYAEAYVRDRVKFSLQGPLLIRADLRERGVPDAIIETTLTEHLPAEAQRERLRKLCEKLHRSRRQGRNNEDNQAARAKGRQKLIAALARQGYEMELIREIVRDLGNQEEGD